MNFLRSFVIVLLKASQDRWQLVNMSLKTHFEF